MATDVFVREGLTQSEMAEIADRYRHRFEIQQTACVDIIEILEFRLPEAFPGFRLVIRSPEMLSDPAATDFANNCIVVREDIYEAAHNGDALSRFILAHELGHYLLHKGKSDVLHKTFTAYNQPIKNMNASESAESQADIFAMHLLIHPSLAFRYRSDSARLAEITGTPLSQARAAATISKRLEFFRLRSPV